MIYNFMTGTIVARFDSDKFVSNVKYDHFECHGAFHCVLHTLFIYV